MKIASPNATLAPVAAPQAKIAATESAPAASKDALRLRSRPPTTALFQ